MLICVKYELMMNQRITREGLECQPSFYGFDDKIIS